MKKSENTEFITTCDALETRHPSETVPRSSASGVGNQRPSNSLIDKDGVILFHKYLAACTGRVEGASAVADPRLPPQPRAGLGTRRFTKRTWWQIRG